LDRGYVNGWLAIQITDECASTCPSVDEKSLLRSSTVCVASQETAAVVVALEQRRLGHEELSSKSGSVRLKPTCCGAFGLDSRLGHPRAEPSIGEKSQFHQQGPQGPLLQDNSAHFHRADHSPANRSSALPSQPEATRGTETENCTCPPAYQRAGLAQHFEEFHQVIL
jgi:hypothetical protein